MSRDHVVTCDRCGDLVELVWNGRQSFDPYQLPKGWIEDGADDVCPGCQEEAKGETDG